MLDNLSIPNIKIEKLYIKWDKKLNISIKEIKIIKQKDKNNTELNLQEIQKYFLKSDLFTNWFESVVIENILYDDISASFKYKDNSNGFLMIKSKNLTLKSSLNFKNQLLNIYINEFQDIERKIKINGNIILDVKNIELISSLFVKINNDLSINLLSFTNKDKLLYKIESLKNIEDIKYIINLFDLPKAILFWARDAIEATSLSINSTYGWLEYQKLDDAYKNLYINATGNNLHYTYNTNLDAIHTKKTDLEFKDGIFFIRPREAYSYGMFLDKSWLKIDFTKKQELLTLHLLFDGKLNKDMLFILQTYKIKLPFLQKKGEIKTNLKIDVNLISIDINAKGGFFTKKANFDYLGLNIDIAEAYIQLDNYDVKVNNMKAKYKDIAKSDVSFTYDAKEQKGDIYFKVSDIEFKDLDLTLKKPFEIVYKIEKNSDKIKLDRSYWEVKNNLLSIEKTILPFDLNSLTIKLPKTLLTNNLITANIAGDIDLKSQKAKLSIDPLNIPQNSLELIYDKNIILSSQDKIKYTYDNIDITIDKIIFNQKNKMLLLDNLTAKHKELGNIFLNKDSVSLNIDINKQKVSIKDLDIYLPALLNGIDSDNKSISKKKSFIDFHIDVAYLDIYLTKNRYLTTDKTTLKFHNNNISASLKHNKGNAIFTYKNDKFNIYGGGFNDTFIENLFNSSDFKGGKFDFNIRGTSKKYDGELYIKNTRILKYTLLNNTLAFINTLPSISTFSLPDFNKHGIDADIFYIKFKQKNDIYNIYDAYLKSKELSVLGNGFVNILNNKIDMNLELKTDLGSSISKIPLVGHIIFDKDCLSTNLKLTGNLDNPKVKTAFTKDILTAPLNILKRTLSLPFDIFNTDTNETN
ncbi:MAG: AsmA-like C-terminal domain-containing protein [Campylobacterota bacterium]|nr:AsmA-like C-terminal domain-containing protein [Campylobacterota bacterium]